MLRNVFITVPVSQGNRFRKFFCGPLLLFAVAVTAGAASLSDSLPLEGNYRQQGKPFSRRKVERFLRNQDSSVSGLAGRSRGFRLTAGGIGLTIWSVNLGISVYQFSALYKAIDRQEPIALPLQQLTTPLLIGGEIATFIQDRFNSRSDYLLHCSALEYNRQLHLRRYPDSAFSLTIDKAKFGWYRQDRLLLPVHVVHTVLREKDSSRPLSNWSLAFREVASPMQALGAWFLCYAIIGYLAPEGVDEQTRSTQLTAGITLTGFGIINAVISRILLKNAISRYNEAVNPAAGKPGIIEEMN